MYRECTPCIQSVNDYPPQNTEEEEKRLLEIDISLTNELQDEEFYD